MAQAPTAPQHRQASVSPSKKRKTQRILNVRLLVISLVAMAACCAVGYLWHDYRASQVAGTLLQRATSLEQDEKWGEAAGYLSRYLQLEPSDTDVRVRLISAVERSADTAARRYRLVTLLYESVGSFPKRTDLRLKLAQQLLDMRDFSSAEVEARKLLSSKQEEDQRAARRVIALSLRARARRGGLVGLEQAAKALAAALADNPGDVTVSSLTADLYREYPSEAGPGITASKADQIMDRLVQQDPKNPEARIARYKYRRHYGIENARSDLDAALAQDANQVEALLLAAGEELAAGGETGRSAAEQKLLKVIKLQPQDPRGHIALAKLYTLQGDEERAVDALVEGRKKLATSSLDLDYALAGLLIDRNRLDEAEKIVADFDAEYVKWLPELTTPGRIRLENMNRLLRARLAFARDDLGKASRELGAIIASVGQTDESAGSVEPLQAYAMLATIMSKLQRPDLAAAYWKTLADRAPSFLDARWKAGAAYLELGRAEDAIEQIEDYLQLPTASPEAWISLVQGHLQRQLSLPSTERNWSEFLAALEQSKRRLPDRWEWQLAEASYWSAQGTKESKRRALERIRLLERNNPKNIGLCERLVLCYQQLGVPADAERALAQYDDLDTSVVRRTTLRAAVWARDGRVKEALQLLSDAMAKVTPQERLKLQLARLTLLLSTRQLDEAHQLVSELIAASPKDSRLLMLGLETALVRQDFATAARWETALKDQSAVDDFDWRFYRARRLIGEFAKLDAATRSELDQLIESLRSDRPSWYPVITLGGQYAELLGNRQQAIDAYQLAMTFGDRRLETLERLVQALYAEGRFNDANQYLSQLGSDQPLQGRFESMAIVAAIKEDHMDEARDMAKQAVARGSKDPLHYVLLANLLLANGERQAAERTFRDSIERFPKDSRVWNGLFAYLVKTEQADRARQVLQRWTECVPMDESNKHFVLGQGQEALGDAVAAQNEYRKAIEHDSRNVNARFRLAKSLLPTDAVAARTEFEEVLRIDSSHAEARRNLAALLAASGDDGDWTQAVQLLQAGAGKEGSDASGSDDRLRAILLARKGKNQQERIGNYEAARRILTTRLNQSAGAGDVVDRMLLAGIYEQQAKLGGNPALIQAARDALSASCRSAESADRQPRVLHRASTSPSRAARESDCGRIARQGAAPSVCRRCTAADCGPGAVTHGQIT